jgi:hypothetical protein
VKNFELIKYFNPLEKYKTVNGMDERDGVGELFRSGTREHVRFVTSQAALKRIAF